MKYYAFFSIILLSSSFVLAKIAKQESYPCEYRLAQAQEEVDQPDKILEQQDTTDIGDIDVQLLRNEAVQELTKAMKELWDTVNYEPDATVKSLLDEQAESYSSLAMEHALEISFNLLEEHGKRIPESIHAAFTRSLSKLVFLSDDFDSDFECDFACEDIMRCSCGEVNPDSITQAYFNS